MGDTDWKQFLIMIVVAAILGMLLRLGINLLESRKMIKDMEKYFGKKLPRNKKGSGEIDWKKVLKMLRKEPTTEKIAHWKELVRKKQTGT